MGGEGGPAHAYDARFLHQGADLFRSKRVRVLGGGEGGTGRVVEVILDHHAHDRHAGKMDARLHSRHLAGNTGMNGSGNESGRVSHLLTHGHLIAHRHAWRAWRADMQGHGDHHTLGRRQSLDRLLIGGGFIIVGVVAAEKGLCHIFTSFSFLNFIMGSQPKITRPYHTPICAPCPEIFRRKRNLIVGMAQKRGDPFADPAAKCQKCQWLHFLGKCVMMKHKSRKMRTFRFFGGTNR